jgi:hypothetical protein
MRPYATSKAAIDVRTYVNYARLPRPILLVASPPADAILQPPYPVSLIQRPVCGAEACQYLHFCASKASKLSNKLSASPAELKRVSICPFMLVKQVN